MSFKHKRLKLNAPGHSLIPKGSQSCSWCINGTLPKFTEEIQEGPLGSIVVYSGGICERCVRFYKNELCSLRWQKFRRSFLASYPYCAMCSLSQKDTLLHHIEQSEMLELSPLIHAEVCDHIKPWRYYPSLFWQEDNIQSLCRSCHDIKTKAERV